jgi:hypothetical protein
MSEMRNEYEIVLGKEEKRPFGRLGRRREDNSRMNLMEMGRKVVGWMNPYSG